MLGKYNILVFLSVLCLVMSIALGIFTIFHIKNITDGVTTSERSKLSDRLEMF